MKSAGLILLALSARAGSAQELLLQPRQGEVLIGPLSFSQTVQGVPLTTRISTFLAVTTKPDQLRVAARVVADFSDLQQKIGALIDTIALPADNCNHFGVDNLVARIWGKQIVLPNSGPILDLHGDLDVWTCTRNPVPCTRVEWDEKEILGAKIRTPRLVTYDCNPPLKTRVNQPFEATLPFRLSVVDPHTVAVELGTPAVNLGGTLGGVTGTVLKIAGVDVNGRVKEILDGAIKPELLQRSLPDDFLRLNPTITRAALLNNSGALAASIELDAAADGKAVGELLQLLLRGH
jgi:hypothetical protein